MSLLVIGAAGWAGLASPRKAEARFVAVDVSVAPGNPGVAVPGYAGASLTAGTGMESGPLPGLESVLGSNETPDLSQVYGQTAQAVEDSQVLLRADSRGEGIPPGGRDEGITLPEPIEPRINFARGISQRHQDILRTAFTGQIVHLAQFVRALGVSPDRVGQVLFLVGSSQDQSPGVAAVVKAVSFEVQIFASPWDTGLAIAEFEAIVHLGTGELELVYKADAQKEAAVQAANLYLAGNWQEFRLPEGDLPEVKEVQIQNPLGRGRLARVTYASQRHEGIEVAWTEIQVLVSLPDGTVVGSGGNWRFGAFSPSKPGRTLQEIRDGLVGQELHYGDVAGRPRSHRITAEDVAESGELIYVPAGALEDAGPESLRLAWKVRVGQSLSWEVYVDAQDGRLLHAVPLFRTLT